MLTFTDLARRFMRENEARLADTTRYNWTNIIVGAAPDLLEVIGP